MGNSRERFGSVHGEHRDHNLVNDFQFRLVKSSDLNEDVLCV